MQQKNTPHEFHMPGCYSVKAVRTGSTRCSNNPTVSLPRGLCKVELQWGLHKVGLDIGILIIVWVY